MTTDDRRNVGNNVGKAMSMYANRNNNNCNDNVNQASASTNDEIIVPNRNDQPNRSDRCNCRYRSNRRGSDNNGSINIASDIISPNEMSLVKIAVQHTILISLIAVVSLLSCGATLIQLKFDHIHFELLNIIVSMIGIKIHLLCLGFQWPFAVKTYKMCCTCCCYYSSLQNMYIAKMIQR